MREFHFQRDHDVSGVSGTGRVAEGVIFEDGKVAIRWLTGNHKAITIFDSIEDAEAVHGHGGLTRVVMDDNLDECKAKLAKIVVEFDPTDKYEDDGKVHGPAFTSGYYRALDRVQQLLHGNINDWKDTRPAPDDPE